MKEGDISILLFVQIEHVYLFTLHSIYISYNKMEKSPKNSLPVMDSTQVISLIIIYTFQAADYCGVLVRIHWSHNYEVFSFQSHNGKMLMGTFEKNMEVAKEVLKKYLKTKMIEKCGKDGNWFLHSRTYVDKLFASMCNKAIIKWADIQNNQGKCPLSLTVLDITRNLIQRLLLNNRV